MHLSRQFKVSTALMERFKGESPQTLFRIISGWLFLAVESCANAPGAIINGTWTFELPLSATAKDLILSIAILPTTIIRQLNYLFNYDFIHTS